MTNLRLNQPRAIISQRYSFLVALPHGWLNHHKIGKGDKIDFEIDDDKNLILKPIRIKRKNAKTKKTQ